MAVKRRQAREWAVQLLFQNDFNAQDVEQSLSEFWKDKSSDEASKSFTEAVVRGVLANQKEIDRILGECVQNWDISRIGAVERNAMRIAIYEMLHRPDIPSVVSINEAVALSKNLSEPVSGRFVNGILDKIRKHLRPDEKTDRSGRSVKDST